MNVKEKLINQYDKSLIDVYKLGYEYGYLNGSCDMEADRSGGLVDEDKIKEMKKIERKVKEFEVV